MPRPIARQALASLRAYSVPRARAPVDLRLDGNEGCAPPEALLDALRALDAEALRRYPSASALEALLAQRLGVDPAQVLVTSGADDALDRICRATLEPGRALLIATPTFEMIARYARQLGAPAREIPWPGGALPVDAMLAAHDGGVGLIALVSPNNPTGEVVTREDLARVSAGAGDALVLLDHAYVEFADEDLTADALGMGNVVVTRTLSKAWGLAGLRVGYAIGPAEVISWLRAVGSPYAVAGPSIALACVRLALPDDDIRAFVATCRAERDALAQAMVAAGGAITRSQANFSYARVAEPLWWRDALAGMGIAARAFDDAVRIACPGDADQLARVTGALATLRPEALLLDMDGVLVDVSGSYRRAIIEAAATFGVEVSHAQIEAIKAAGDANNDWIVTWRLVQAAGQDATLEQVTFAFERLYQGDEAREGLWRTERALIARSSLERLRRGAQLAVVTGRPRRDAARAIETFGWQGLFEVVICMEDAPPKPDPAPLRLALERLGARTAWMIGDTPDDVRAARRVSAPGGPHVLALGTRAPGARPAGDDALYQAGAARIYDSITALIEEVWPYE